MAEPKAARKPRRKSIRSVDEFYKHLDLKDIVYTDLHVWSNDDGVEEEDKGKATLEANYTVSDDSTVLLVNLRALLSSEDWNYQVAVLVTYQGKGPFQVSEEVVGHILNDSTVVTALPFLRGGVMDLASRVRDLPIPVLPLAGPATGRYLIRND